MKTIFLLNGGHSHLIRNGAGMGIDKNDRSIIINDRSHLRDELMEHHRIKRMTQFIDAILIRLKLPQPRVLSHGIDDIESYAVVVAVDVSIADDEDAVLHKSLYWAAAGVRPYGAILITLTPCAM